jgi:hypothetical protein
VVEALGPAVAAPLVDLLERDAHRARAAAQVLTQHAALLAPAVVPMLDRCSPAVVRTLLRVLGSAGPGFEESIAKYVGGDEQTGREALRALARLGTPKAAALVAAEIEKQRGALSAAAEETLWHFPAAEALRHTRELLSRRDFTTTHTQATERLLDRAARANATGLEPVLQELAAMRFRVWTPAIARMARKAHAMLKSAGAK